MHNVPLVSEVVCVKVISHITCYSVFQFQIHVGICINRVPEGFIFHFTTN